ncbi:serine hydrolase domain-containing protein [Flagellimonas sp. S174]|uniref:serine hydrolase domain-containing protein n=1 Tax=Flagellimonas sp. S174 TaxID=3410790 RepID=UPI003BF575AD
MKKITHLLAILLLLTCCNITPKEPKSIDGKIEKALADNNIPSVSVGVIKNGKIELMKGYGNLSRNDSTKVDENSIFQIASQSKMFTGIITNTLIQEGKLNIDEPVITYLPKEISENSRKALSKITLKNILNHTAGIPSDACSVYSERIEGEAWSKGYSKDNLVEDIDKLGLEFNPDAQFQYSNSGYAMIGLILEEVSGLSYKALLKKYVSDVYSLKNTVVDLNSEQKSALVTPYKKDKREIATKPSNMGMATPASAIFSNAADLTKILLAQLNAYRENKTQSPLILTNQTSQMDDGLEYGFGLIKETKGENVKYGHGGDADGFACEYFLNPEKNIGVVLLTSSGGRWVGELANSILEDLK